MPLASYTLRKGAEKLKSILFDFPRTVGKFICFAWLSISMANAKPVDATVYEFDIPSQPLIKSLNALSNQTETLVLFPYSLVVNRKSSSVKGRYTVRQALDAMLLDTGLVGGVSEKGVLMISEKSEDDDNERREAMKSRKNILAAVIGVLVGSGGAQEVVAQSDSDMATKRSPVLEEVIVTAQKRAESLQDIPAAISALSADMIKNRGIVSPEDLQFSVPGLTIGETVVGTSQVSIRGVGTESIDAGGDPGVPLHIDGHYVQFASYILQDLLDVERIEVQRGPQGTLYGRNAVGGNINIITKRPTEEFEGMFSADVGNYSKRRIQGVISGPLTESLRGRIAISDQKRNGFVENVSSGDDDLLNSDYTAIRGSLEYDLTSNIELFLSGYYYNDDSLSFVNRVVGEYPEGGYYALLNLPYTNISARNPQKVSADAPLDAGEDAKGISLDLSWDLGALSFRSLSAYHDAERELLQDLDATDSPLHNWDQFNWLKSKSYTQEFQLLSDTDKSVKWIVGLFYFQEDQDYYFDITGLDARFGDTIAFVIAPIENETRSVAAFGQLDYSLTEKLEVTAGLRHTRDEKEIFRSLSFSIGGAPAIPNTSNLDDSWEQTSGKLGLNYHVSEDVMFYASYSLGFKAGGFNGASPTEPSFKPEILDAYEVGMKGRFFDDRLLLNASAFYYDYTDKVERKITLIPGTNVNSSLLTNAAAATVTGLEVETQAYLTDSLRIDASIGYQKSEYDDFDSQDPANAALGVQDLAGNTLPRAPDWKFHIGAQYEWQLDGDLGNLMARVDYAWVDEQYFRPFNLETDKADSYHRTNARLQWESGDAHWLAELYVLNLEDDDVISNLNRGGAGGGFVYLGSYLSPRTYGLKVDYRF